MTFDDYTAEAKQYRLDTAETAYILLGLCAEAGEVADKFAKGIRDGRPRNFKEQVAKELGDLLWFVAMLADDLGYNLDTIAQQNLEKLASRQKAGTIQGSGDNR